MIKGLHIVDEHDLIQNQVSIDEKFHLDRSGNGMEVYTIILVIIIIATIASIILTSYSRYKKNKEKM